MRNARFEISERRARRILEQPRSSQRYVAKKADKDTALVGRMSALSIENPRYGYRRMWALLGREGWEVNKKRVQRLWREADLKVPKKQHESRRLLGGGENNGCPRRRAEYPITMSGPTTCAMNSTEDGRRLKVMPVVMPVVDEYTRECLSLEGQRSITKPAGVMDTPRGLFIERGEPNYLRSDNGPEFIAKALKEWLWRSAE